MDNKEIITTGTEESGETPNKAKRHGIFRRAIPRKRWADMSPAQKAGNMLMAAVQVTMVAFALADLRRRQASEIRGSKRIWAMTAFIQPFGPVIYFIFGRKKPALSADAGQLLPA